MRRNAGFTLVEIAIVLVVLGFLIAGVFRGNELIRGAQVRRLAADHDGFRTAVFGFVSRYRAMPGDYARASVNITCAAPCLNGNGNERIESNAVPFNGSEVHEELLAWMHLAGAGFIGGGYRMTAGETAPTSQNSPVNSSGRYWQLVFDNVFGTAGTSPPRHNLKTGNLLPVEMVAELDRKVDDGLPNTGSLQFSTYAVSGDPLPTGGFAAQPSCTSGPGLNASWNATNGSRNCGAASLF